MSNQISTAQQQSRLKELIAKGKEQGFLTYSEVNDHLPDDISDPEQIEDIIRMINDMGITVYETAPDADELLSNEENTADELAAEEAAAALAAGYIEVRCEHERGAELCIRHVRAEGGARKHRVARSVALEGRAERRGADSARDFVALP